MKKKLLKISVAVAIIFIVFTTLSGCWGVVFSVIADFTKFALFLGLLCLASYSHYKLLKKIKK